MQVVEVPSPPRRTRNAAATRAHILAVARAEFVAHGLSGARMDCIASACAVNKSLLYHYFGSKEDLYLAVIEDIWVSLRANQRDAELLALPPEQAMRRLVTNTFDHFVATPELIRLMSVENIHNARHLQRSTVVKPLYGNLLDTLQTILKRGQSEGIFRRKVDVIDLYLSISGLAYFFLSNQHTLSWLLDRTLVTPRRVAARRRHVVDMVLAYLVHPQPEGQDVPAAQSGERRQG
jgi:TetR/AcrR family transcriptional regulator